MEPKIPCDDDGIEQCHKVAFDKGKEKFLEEVDGFSEMSVEKYLNKTTVSPKLYHSLTGACFIQDKENSGYSLFGPALKSAQRRI